MYELFKAKWQGKNSNGNENLIKQGVFLPQNQYHDDSSSCPDPQNS